MEKEKNKIKKLTDDEYEKYLSSLLNGEKAVIPSNKEGN